MAASWGNDSQLYKRYIAQLVNLYSTRSDVRAFTEVILSVLAIFVFGVFALRPTLTTIGGLTTDIQQKRDTVAQMDTKINNIIAAQALYDAQITNINLLETAVPTNPDVFGYIEQAEQIAIKNGVQISSFTVERVSLVGEEPVAPIEAGAVKAAPTTLTEKFVNFTVSFTGPYVGLFQSLSDLEQLRRPFGSKSVFMSNDTTSTGTAITLTITGSTPYIKN